MFPIDEWKETFDLFAHGENAVSTKDLRFMIRAAGVEITEQRLLEIIQDIDVRTDGFVTFREFTNVLKTLFREQRLAEEYADAFKALDTTNAGYLTAAELMPLLAAEDDIAQIADEHGRVTLSAFIELMTM
jgi:Ca2+-binding EF-hand superfamily protein